MEYKLTFRAEKSLRILNLKIGPNEIWNVKLKHASFIMNSQLDWSIYKISAGRKMLAQTILLNCWNPESLDGLYVLNAEKVRRYVTLIRLLLIAEDLFPNKPFREYERGDWIKICLLALFKAWKKSNSRIPELIDLQEPLTSPMLTRSITVFKEWYALYQRGEVSDGPEFSISTTDVEALLKPELIKLGSSLDEWKKYDSYGTVPFAVAHLLLADALSIIYSNRTKLLLAYFSIVKENNCHHLIRPFWRSKGLTRINRYVQHGDIALITNHPFESHIGGQIRKYFIVPLHGKLNELREEDKPFSFPWKCYGDLTQHYNELLTAIYIVFLSVMGKRGPSEVQGFRALDIIPSDDDLGRDAIMKPRIYKTNKGLRETQGVTNFIDDVSQILLNISYVDKKNDNAFLFTVLSSLVCIDKQPRRISPSQMGYCLKAHFDKFCVRAADFVDFEVKDIHDNIHSHQFRHAFAEFGLRRFDGSVEELIRQHFCHSPNHWWTKRYTGDKLDADREQYLSKQYIKELVPRILRDLQIDQDFVGGMALFIKKELGPKIRSMDASSAEEYIAQFCDNFLQITPHEYGWCLLHEQFLSVAKCADVKGNPNPAATSSSKCVTCSNFCASRKAHLEVQTQIAIAHIDFIESDLWMMPSLKQASISAVKAAQNLFPELKELGEVE